MSPTATYQRSLLLDGRRLDVQVVMDDMGIICGIGFAMPGDPLGEALKPSLQEMAKGFLKSVLAYAVHGKTPHEAAEDYPSDCPAGAAIMRAIGDLQLSVMAEKLKTYNGSLH